jgi:hypothetical protein
LLDRVWPAWGAALAALTARGLPPTSDGWTALEDAQRADGMPTLPEQLNRRTAAALAAPHSKALLTERRLAALGDIDPTHDGSVRLRPPRGLTARTARGSIDLAEVAAVLGEVSLSERGLMAGLELHGPIRALLLVENLGAFCDLAPLDGWLLAHVPGWNTATVSRLLECVAGAPAIHFGDLDPNGMRIFQHLRGMRTDLEWFVPEFWGELVEMRGLPGVWPDELELESAPALVQRLATRGLWLEQETIVIDARTAVALEAMVARR